jgi:hypothetical protein
MVVVVPKNDDHRRLLIDLNWHLIRFHFAKQYSDLQWIEYVVFYAILQIFQAFSRFFILVCLFTCLGPKTAAVALLSAI